MASERLLGDWIRRRRADLDLTQELLAEQVGCAVDTIRALEDGRRRASRPMADRLATVLHIPSEERVAFMAAARELVQAPSAPTLPDEPGKTERVAQRSAFQTPALLATKLYRPRQTQDVVVRPRLIERLEQGLAEPLTLICAPAGFGKTTLVADRLAQLAVPSAWLALDAHDDAPGTFLRYIVAALQGIDPAIGAQVIALLERSELVVAQAEIGALLNDLVALPHDCVLVLDDLHVLTHPAIYEALAYLLDHSPPQLHLVILTREDPPLPLSRLRARRHLVEVRAADLRFTLAEADTFLHQAMHVSLDADRTAALVDRTEGWVVGLQLAALSLRDLGMQDGAAAIDAFTGNNRYVVDYLVDEVIGGQPPHVRHFLLQTSILERLCGTLCDALLLGDASDAPSASDARGAAYSQQILEVLERANLFLLRLDNERHWYRYHHLFAEVLQARLASGATLEQITRLRQRASAWCEEQGLLPEAVHYALAAHDWERAVRLLEQHGTPYALHGHIETVLGWLGALPDDSIRARPDLYLLQAGLLLATQQFGRAAARLDWVEHIVEPVETDLQARSILATVAILRSIVARFAGDLATNVALGQRALEYMQGQPPPPGALLSIAHAFLVTGDVSEVAEQQVVTLLAPLENAQHFAIAVRRSMLWAWMRVMQGRLRDAERVYRRAPQLIAGQEQSLALTVGGAAYYFGLGDLLREWNDLDGATQLLEQGMVLARGSLALDPNILLDGMAALARVHQARGQVATARATLREFGHLTQGRTVAAYLSARLAAMEAHFAVLAGDLLRASQWAETVDISATADLSYLREVEYLTLARLKIAQGRADPAGAYLSDAVQLLDRLLAGAEQGARRSSMIGLLIPQALALDVQGSQREALNTLARALGLAAPEGYVRVFVDEGAPMRVLLARAVRERGWDEAEHQEGCDVRVYAQQLLAVG